MLRLMMIFLLVIGLSFVNASAQEPGDAQAGLQYARQYCSPCHEVERHSDIVPKTVAPAFYEIADTEGITGRALAVALDTSHENMPDFVLPTEDRNDVIAYILSLRSARK